ncbi:MAG: hypothetical protein AAGG48_25700 [Planctomycetota bacterium]
MKQNRRTWIACVAIAVFTLLFHISGFFVWSSWNCWNYDVDIRTGRIRYTRYLLHIKIVDRTEETWVSRSTTSDKSQKPLWMRVSTFSPFTDHSPHYSYHGARHQIRCLEQAQEFVPFEPAARIKAADTLLELWQSGETDESASEFVDVISNRASQLFFESRSEVFTFDDLSPYGRRSLRDRSVVWPMSG